MNPAQLIAKKRDGGELSSADIEHLLRGFLDGRVADYQMAAFAMAVCCRGMTVAETASLTRSMLQSGVTLQWPEGPPVVDKHSTGGIGDKTSLPLAAMLACSGLRVPMISGRGLGATGGTLDKLESIRGFRTDLSLQEIMGTIERTGCVITGATSDLAPADRKLYALRDVTATVESIPLITASIMSKKLAEGLDALVLDVKWGSGAFMQTLEDARRLACSLVDTGQAMGVPTVALITDMNQPLGRMAGNAVEVNEAIALLEGNGPADLLSVTLALGAQLLLLAGVAPSEPEALATLQQTIDSGAALAKFREMVAAQGGDLDAPRRISPAHSVVADEAGYVQSVDAQRLGWTIIELGGGRRKKGDAIDHSVGVETHVRIGDRVERGEPLATLLAPVEAHKQGGQMVLSAFKLGSQPAEPPWLLVERIS